MTLVSLDRAVAHRHPVAGACLLGLACLAVLVGRLGAEPLPKETCDLLKGEQDTLANGGIKDEMAKGPEWARNNLKAERLKAIERYIDIGEQLSFRCGLAKAKLTLPEEPAPDLGGPAKVESPNAKPKPRTRPTPKAAAAPKGVGDHEPGIPSEAGASPTLPPSRPSSKPKPKAKVDDAYRPAAPAEPTSDPFARQLAPKG